MTSVQSWLLLPSSWCEDEHLYPTPLDQGSEQPLSQPLDHQATSLPSRGERALSQVVCSSHLHGFLQCCHFLPMFWRLTPRVPSPPHSWACEASSRSCHLVLILCALQRLEPPLSFPCLKYPLPFFFFSGFQNVF